MTVKINEEKGTNKETLSRKKSKETIFPQHREGTSQKPLLLHGELKNVAGRHVYLTLTLKKYFNRIKRSNITAD
jgi:hypothetical protein